MANTILFMEDVSVSFDGFKALNKLNFSVDYGELRCVIGPNGAGKSTMLDVVTGKIRPDTGSVIFKETTHLDRMQQEEIANAGIGRKFQTPTIYENLTVRDNLELSAKQDKTVKSMLFGGMSGSVGGKVNEVLDVIGLEDKQYWRAGLLAHGEKQWLEIGMVVVQDPDLLLVDEPVAGMSESETENTAILLKRIAEERSVLVIEHDMNFVREIAKRVTVLHEGAVICEGSIDHVHADAQVIELYLGRG
ncbi:MAG: urea ABC transporter ATP-binding protein UrtD [Nitrospinaceae bacterium]|jgi:urea transport system ATP-binding protein|nr:urea ABC transporter ATP-binding protein UrtD [Nitrospinaceae bacterium]MBT3432752.1 urea ABC transporter ATP-binding protein UrtD [Nitrospinaceae bacterium]MBT3821052.1 urea ABC transporter ATP-binding protein UrtD [Nitrospinaceae bacterium]MBT4094385.1 urea ABC transporter ATP-binding protein UrtD [Nitrospinaceae bacterium]MBT4429825.1 urea ABC transporter ATP-binding protein UrtD [Nitrospinaceae bacterium]